MFDSILDHRKIQSANSAIYDLKKNVRCFNIMEIFNLSPGKLSPMCGNVSYERTVSRRVL